LKQSYQSTPAATLRNDSAPHLTNLYYNPSTPG
jgi:hypothetical protein